MPTEALRIMPEAVPEPIGEPAMIGEPLERVLDAMGRRTLLMTADDLAQEFRASLKTIRRMDAAGRLPRAIKIGHAKRWPRATIVAWLTAGAPNRKEWEAFHEPRMAKGRAR